MALPRKINNVMYCSHCTFFGFWSTDKLLNKASNVLSLTFFGLICRVSCDPVKTGSKQ